MRNGMAVLLVAVISAALLAQGETPRALVQEGNGHYDAQRYMEALDAYERALAASEGEPPAALLHDLAAANYRLGRLEEARALWRQVKTRGDGAWEARTRYNLGNCEYQAALGAMQQADMQGALAKLGEASAQYREALRLDPSLGDARANLEMTYLLRRQIEEQAQQQPQQNQQSQQGEQDNEQQEQQQPSSQPSSEDQQQDQQQASPDEQQEQPDEPGSDQQQEGAEEAQPPPEPAEPTSQPSEAAPQPQPVEITLTPEQAERLLQMVRDAEKQRREQLARQRAAGQKPVERDW
jgi:Ca-activated chloride channel family protein